MKNRLKLLLLPLILAFLLSLLGINALADDPSTVVDFDDIALTVGRNKSERLITWYSSCASDGVVYYAPASKMQDGAFPTAANAAVTSSLPAENAPGYYSHKATLSGLLPDTDYVYRLYIDGRYSELYYFSTDPTGDFEFIFVGDPQVSTSSHSES